MTKRAVLLNSLSGVALFAANTAIAFVMSPIMIHSLGNRRYGVWEVIITLVGYLGALELGLGSALVRFIADAKSREDRDALECIVNTGLFGLAALGAFGLLVVLLGVNIPGLPLGIDTKGDASLTPVLFIFGINLAVYLPRVALSAYLLGLQAHRIMNGIVLMATLGVTFAMYHILTTGVPSPLFWMSLAMLSGTIAQVLLMSVWIGVVDRRIRIAVSSFSMKMLKELLGFGIKNAAIGSSLALVDRVVSVVIAYTAGVAQIVYFVMPNRLVDYTRTLVSQAGFPLTPYFADLAGRGEFDAVRTAWVQTSRILQVVTLGVPVALAILGEPFIRVWIGPEYAVRGRWILYILCAGLFVQGVAANRERLLVSLGRHGRLALLTSILALGSFGVSIVLGYLWGIKGVAAAVAGFFIVLAGLEVTLTCKVLDMSLPKYFRETALRLVGPLVAMAAVLIGLREVAYPRGYGQIVLYGLAGSVVYLTAAWFIGLEAGERQFVRNLMGGMRRKVVLALRPAFERGRR